MARSEARMATSSLSRQQPWGAGTPTRKAIAAAALRLVDRGGVEDLSIRRLAAALGVHPTSIYRRASSRDDILDLVADAVLAEIDLGKPEGSWQERLVAFALEFRAAVVRHPNAAALLNSWTVPQESNLAISEAIFQALELGGFSGRRLLEAYVTYVGFVLGASVTEVLERPTGISAANASRAPLVPNPDSHPNLASAFDQFSAFLDASPVSELRREIFRSGIEAVLAGLEVRRLPRVTDLSNVRA